MKENSGQGIEDVEKEPLSLFEQFKKAFNFVDSWDKDFKDGDIINDGTQNQFKNYWALLVSPFSGYLVKRYRGRSRLIAFSQFVSAMLYAGFFMLEKEDIKQLCKTPLRSNEHHYHLPGTILNDFGSFIGLPTRDELPVATCVQAPSAQVIPPNAVPAEKTVLRVRRAVHVEQVASSRVAVEEPALRLSTQAQPSFGPCFYADQVKDDDLLEHITPRSYVLVPTTEQNHITTNPATVTSFLSPITDFFAALWGRDKSSGGRKLHEMKIYEPLGGGSELLTLLMRPKNSVDAHRKTTLRPA